LKKTIWIITLMTCFIFLSSCSNQAPSSAPQSQSQSESEKELTEPEVLDLGVLTNCNTLEGEIFHNGDEVYKAQIKNTKTGLFFKVFLRGSDPPEDGITFYSKMVGDNAPESIEQNIEYFYNDDGVGISGTVGNRALSTDVYIGKTDKGYDVQITNDVSDEYKQYLDKIAENFHNGAVCFNAGNTGINVLYFEFDAESELLEVNLEENSIICMRTYLLDKDTFSNYLNYFTSDSFIEAMGENTENDPDIIVDGSSTNIQCQQGDIFIGIALNSEDFSIILTESVNAINQSISQYNI